MKRMIILDSGPLGMAVHPTAKGTAQQCQAWLNGLLEKGERIAIPEIADYEVRRELLRAGLTRSLRRLDALVLALEYLPIDTEVMRLAAEIWSQARRTGQPTADAKALDGDVILAAQATLTTTPDITTIVATTNVGHLARFTLAELWEAID
jgi:predicted nucleic acid-binding protein